MAEKILVTGFDSFGARKRPNRSSETALPAVKEKYGDLVKGLVLPTSRDIAAEQLRAAIEDIDPAAIVMFGISAGSKVRLEQRAKNKKFNILVPDNAGKRAIGQIDPTGPKKLYSTLPLDDLYTRLNMNGVPTKLSNNAGEFICNEVMYRTLQHMSERDPHSVIPTGFIHLGNGLSNQMVEEASLHIMDELIKCTDQAI